MGETASATTRRTAAKVVPMIIMVIAAWPPVTANWHAHGALGTAHHRVAAVSRGNRVQTDDANWG